MIVPCRVCLQTIISDCGTLSNVLLEFYKDLCEKDVYEQAGIKFCSICEELLRNFFDFRQKCRYSNDILKSNHQGTHNDDQELCTLNESKLKYIEPSISIENTLTEIKEEKAECLNTEITKIQPELEHKDIEELINLKVEDTFYCDDLVDSYDDDYVPQKRKKKRKKEDCKREKEDRKVTNKCKDRNANKKKLRDRILELMKFGEFQNLGDDVVMNKELFTKMFDKSNISKAKCTMLLQDRDTKEELDRLKSYLLYLLKKNNPEYEDMFDIEILDTEELKQREFDGRKLSKEFMDAEFKCEICFKVFDVQRLLDYHRKWHEPATGSNVCEICSMRFARPKSLAQHHKDNHCAVYRCKLCPLITYNFSVMVNHYHHHKGKEYPCPVCLSVFSNKSTMNNHRLQAHKTAHICPLCARCFVSEKGLYFHKQLKHKDEDITPLSQTVSCDKCDAQLSSEQVLHAHIRQMHSALTIHKCYHCKEVFRTLDELRQHKVSSNHQRSPRIVNKKSFDDTPVPLNSEEKPFCEECDKTFNTRKGYLRHYNMHHNVHRVHKCGFCQATFATAEEIEAHRAAYNHHLKERYVKRRASVKPRLDKPFDKCELCGETVGTDRVNSMYQHFVTSHPDTPYSSVYRNPHNRHLCELCGKTFKDLRFFLDHHNLHTGEKPYRCGVCSRSYASKRHLGWHEARHGPPKHRCALCHKMFNSAANLFAHRRSHVGDRRFKCDICSKGFLHQAALNEHVRGVHNHIRRSRKCRDK